ncbi:MAG: hypothetical protein IT486_03095 [Gammaproteobacteria bacterium]|nr:hypothetical protein [Gammaproteobacteria bacterium]
MRSLALALAVIAAPLATAGAASITDNFDDNSFDASLWTVINDGSGITVAEVNQRVEVALAADAAGAFFGGYRSNAVFSGDLDVEVSYTLLDWPSTNGVRVGLSLVTGWQPSAFWNVERISGGTIEAFDEVYITDYNTLIGAHVATADTAGRLRIARSGSTISAWYWQDDAWSLLRSEPESSGDVSIAFAAWSEDAYFGNELVRVGFDDVSIVPLPGTAIGLLTGLAAALVRARGRKG